MRIEEIRVEPQGPSFAKPHPKQESIWAMQNHFQGQPKVDFWGYIKSKKQDNVGVALIKSD